MSKILINTNLVYGIDEDSAFIKRARKILEQQNNKLVITSKNLVEFLAVTYPTDRLHISAVLNPL